MTPYIQYLMVRQIECKMVMFLHSALLLCYHGAKSTNIIHVIRIQFNKNADSSAADKGTVQLSSLRGINSTPAEITAIANNLSTNPIVSSSTGAIAPILVNQEIKLYEPKKDPATNAALPAIDLLLLKDHLFEDPNLRPTKSANPSPRAIVAIDTTPMGESVQKNRVETSITIT
mmetsp:Transcript_37836/g.80814  ORF Transcript_37836/g.80814 Transcript_37836/m.80814 type:complete len:174 (-) Transcript_37836:782-1303(-)